MSGINQIRLAKGMRWTGRIVASISVIWFLTVVIVAISVATRRPFDIPFTFNLETTTFIGLELVGLAGLILTWRKEVVASGLLIIASVGLGINMFVDYQPSDFLAWTVIGLPYLIGSILIVGSRRLPNKSLPNQPAL